MSQQIAKIAVGSDHIQVKKTLTYLAETGLAIERPVTSEIGQTYISCSNEKLRLPAKHVNQNNVNYI
jgi:hypothetical protein